MVEEVTQWALDGDLGIERFGEAAALTVVGRGVGFAVACEIALKIREVSGLRAESYAVSDYLHGPVGADGERCVLLVVVTDELSDEVLAATVRDSQAAGMLCVFLRPASRILSGADAEIVLPFSGPNWVVGLGQVIIGQVLALRIGEYRGRPIDTSPRLRKVTLSA
jgi:glucosamine--fructose-6-phosphate aminotransferase (isomerizing)